METPVVQSSGEINPLLSTLVEELPLQASGRARNAICGRGFLRTLDKLYKVKE
jgi:hypothetical protein